MEYHIHKCHVGVVPRRHMKCGMSFNVQITDKYTLKTISTWNTILSEIFGKKQTRHKAKYLSRLKISKSNALAKVKTLKKLAQQFTKIKQNLNILTNYAKT